MYKVSKLSNGIRVVTEKADYLKTVSAGVWVSVGSAMETKLNNGMSHFIEHMLFKGTQNRSAKEIAEFMESVGGQLNAATYKEYTCLSTKTLSEHIDRALELLSDMICNSTFTDENMETERDVISEEINMYEDTPEDVVHDLFDASIWEGTSIGLPILGTSESVESITKADMLTFFDNFYCGENMVISVMGNFDEDEVMALLEQKFGHIKRGNPAKLHPRVEAKRGFRIRKRNIEQCHLCAGFQSIDRNDEQFYDLLIMDSLFGGNMSSRLFQRVREDAGLAYSIYTDMDTLANNGSFVIYAGLNPKGVEKAMRIINDEIKLLKREKLTMEEIETAKMQLKASVVMDDERVYSRMSGYARGMLFDNKIETSEDIIEQIEKINRESVASIIDRVLDINTLNIALHGKVVGNEKNYSEIMDF